VIEARLHSAKVVDRDGIKLLLEPSLCPIACPACATCVAGCLSTAAKREGRRMGRKHTGMEYPDSFAPPAQETAPEEVMMRWAKEWAKEGLESSTRRSSCSRKAQGHPCRGVGWWRGPFLGSPTTEEDELRDYERLPETGEALIYAAMSRLMARRLARS
jgi:putative transposase